MSNKPKHIRNEAGQYRCTCTCGKQFWCSRFNGKFCSEHCRMQALSNAREDRKRKVPATITNTCEACGVRFVGKRPYLAYITCGAPECRLEIRRRRGKESGEKTREQALKRFCLKCDRKFKAANRFNRICQACKDNLGHRPTGAEWWGGVAI